MTADETANVPLLPGSMGKQQFGRQLYNLMIKKGWKQSELGRRADIPRDSISTYVRGKALPTHQNLIKLAQALGVTEQELMPSRAESAIDADNPEVSLKISPGEPSRAWLRVNQLVTRETATRILEILDQDRAKLFKRGTARSEPSTPSGESLDE